MVQKATQFLSQKLNTPVSVSHVYLGFFNHVDIQGVYIADEQKDTLAHIGSLKIRTSELLSNYWHGTTPVLQSLALDNVYVNLYRNKNSDRWNYDFISDAFGSNTLKDTIEKEEPKEEKLTNKQNDNALPELDIKKLICNNIRFKMYDAWSGEDMHFIFEKLNININKSDLPKKIIDIDQLQIVEGNILVKEYTGGKPKKKKIIDSSDWGTPFNPDLFKLTIQKIDINNTEFAFIDGDINSTPGEFDATNLQLKDINIQLKNTQIIADTIFSDIENISAIERSGLKLVKLKAKLKLSQVQAQLAQMELKTNNSTLQNHFEMQYNNFHDFEDFIYRVKMIADFDNSDISSKDIAYFAPILNTYPINIKLSGTFNGTVDNMYADEMLLQAGNTHFQGDAHVAGLPDIDKTIFTADVKKLHTSGSDLNKLIPQTRIDAIAWNELKNIDFNGTYNGTVSQFHAKGNLNTSLGNAALDIALNLKQNIPAYNGTIQAHNIELGKLLKQASLGKITADADFNGKGFDMATINTKLKAVVKEINIDGNTYRDLHINGVVSNKTFDGIFVSQDPNLAFNFSGSLNLSGKEPIMNFNSRILHLDLQKLGISPEPMKLSCIASLHFTGDDIDNFDGNFILQNITLTTNNNTIHIDTVAMEAYEKDKIKIIELKSSLVDAYIKGNFNISKLGDAFQLYLSHYMPQYVKKPNTIINEHFHFQVQLKDISHIIPLFVKNVSGLDQTLILGELNTFEKKFSLDATIPNVQYNQIALKNTYIVGAGNFQDFDMSIYGGNIIYENQLLMPSFQINGSMSNNYANLEIITQSINELLGGASIKLKGTAIDDELYVNLEPSHITLKQDKWGINCANTIKIGKDIEIKNLNVESGAQQIQISTHNNGNNDLLASIANIDLESISDYINFTSPIIYGRLNGSIEVKDFMNKPVISTNIFSSNTIRIDNDTIGIVRLNAHYDIEKQLLTIDKNTSLERDKNNTLISGYVNLKDSTLQVNADLNNTSIAFLSQFLDDFLKDIRGNITGKVDINGKIEDPNIQGSLLLKDYYMKVIMLGTAYHISQAKFNFNNEKIQLGDITIKDEREGNYIGTISGKITHKNFSNFKMDVTLKSSNLLCMNLKSWESDLFYGYIPAELDAKIEGALENLFVNINTKPLLGATYYLPLGGTGDASTFEYVKFREIGRNQIEEKTNKGNNALKLTLNIDATPDIETIIVMDKNTGEEIRAKGNGNLKIILDIGNNMEMYGNYVITDGKYNFKFRGVVNRSFTIDEGSQIKWTGDALGAIMDVKAIYQLPKPLALYPLVSAQVAGDKTEEQEAKRTYKTLVPLKLSGVLSQPKIEFDIIQPDNKSIGSIAYTKLEQIRNDERELFNQAGILLLLGEFRSSEGLSGNAYSQSAISTVSDLVGSAVSGEITNQFQNLTGLKGISLNVNYQNMNQEATLTNINRDRFSFNVSANLFKERLIVDFGNSLDVSRDASGNSSSNFYGDFKAQLLLTKDGRVRANAYRTNNVDIGGAPFTRGGVGISYKKVFNSFSDLFHAKKSSKPVINDTTANNI